MNIYSENDISELIISNTLGQIVLTTTDKNIDVSSFKNGVLLIIILTDNAMVTKCFIKNNLFIKSGRVHLK